MDDKSTFQLEKKLLKTEAKKVLKVTIIIVFNALLAWLYLQSRTISHALKKMRK